MKNAILLLLLSPSAYAGTVARIAVAPAAFVAPILLMAPSMPGLMTPSITPALSMTPALSAPSLSVPALAAPALVAQALPAAAIAVPIAAPAAVPAALAASSEFRTMAAAIGDAPGSQDPARTPEGWSDANRRFDGAGNSQTGAQLVDPSFGSYRRLSYNEQNKLDATVRYGNSGSQVFAALNGEFQQQGGYYLLDSNPNARYMAAAAMDSNRRPVILLTHDLLNRYNGRDDDAYRGAPWEFIASLIAREQVFYNAWYAAIPASAEKLSISFMNMTRVFVDLPLVRSTFGW